MKRVDKKQEEELFNILSWSVYTEKFYQEFQTFLTHTGFTEMIGLEDVNAMFVLSQKWEHWQEVKRIVALQRLLTRKLEKINASRDSDEEKMECFLHDIIGEKNVLLIKEYIDWMEQSELNTKAIQTLEDRHAFLTKAWDRLVKPIIAWGMWATWLFNFTMKWWADAVSNIESLSDRDQILAVPWVWNIVHGFITLAVLYTLKKSLKVIVWTKRARLS